MNSSPQWSLQHNNNEITKLESTVNNKQVEVFTIWNHDLQNQTPQWFFQEHALQYISARGGKGGSLD